MRNLAVRGVVSFLPSLPQRGKSSCKCFQYWMLGGYTSKSCGLAVEPSRGRVHQICATSFRTIAGLLVTASNRRRGFGELTGGKRGLNLRFAIRLDNHLLRACNVLTRCRMSLPCKSSELGESMWPASNTSRSRSDSFAHPSKG
jgi:hypothetical protein